MVKQCTGTQPADNLSFPLHMYLSLPLHSVCHCLLCIGAVVVVVVVVYTAEWSLQGGC